MYTIYESTTNDSELLKEILLLELESSLHAEY